MFEKKFFSKKSKLKYFFLEVDQSLVLVIRIFFIHAWLRLLQIFIFCEKKESNGVYVFVAWLYVYVLQAIKWIFSNLKCMPCF